MSKLDGFSTPQPLPAGGSWTATYESTDQRNDLAFYIVDLRPGGPIWAEVHVRGPEWILQPGFRPWLREQLARVAASGEPNTTHEGTMSTRLRLQAEGRAVASAPRVLDGIFD